MTSAVEVADSSIAYDLGPKARAYGSAGIRELWVVEVPSASVVVHRAPRAGGYDDITRVALGDRLSPQAFPNVSLPVADFVAAAGT